MTKSGAAEGHIAQEPRIEEHKGGGYTYAYLPARKGNPLTLVMLHGTGGDHTSFIGMGRLVAPGAALIALRGDVVENGKLRFFRRTGEGVHDMSDLRLRTVRVAMRSRSCWPRTTATRPPPSASAIPAAPACSPPCSSANP